MWDVCRVENMGMCRRLEARQIIGAIKGKRPVVGASTRILHCTCMAQYDIGIVDVEKKAG